MKNIKIQTFDIEDKQSDTKDKFQIELLKHTAQQLSSQKELSKDIDTLIRTTQVNKNDTYGLIRKKRRKRNMLLTKVSTELCLVDQPLGLPWELMIEPTNLCNLKCPLCPAGNGTMRRKTGKMTFEEFKKIIDQLEDELRRMIFWGFGEPYINKDATKMIKYAVERKINVLSSTNGTFLNNQKLVKEIVDSGLQTLFVAIDGLTQETLNKYRLGADLQNIINGVQLIREMRIKRKKSTPALILQFVVTRKNEHELKMVEAFSKKSGFDTWSIKTANIMATTDTPYFDILAEKFIPEHEQNSRFLRTNNGKLRIKGEILNKCHILFGQTMINWDGDAIPCCWDAHSDHVLGNVFKDGFTKVWFGENYKKFRQTVFKDRQCIQICCDCPIDRTIPLLTRRL